MLLLSRSAIEARLRCAREFFWRYLYLGSGFSERWTPLHLALGIAHHKAMETLIRSWDGEGLDVDGAIKAGVDSWHEERPGGTSQPEEPPVQEILALIEAFVRGWVRVEASRFFSEFEVVDVEREATPQPMSPSAALQFRADVVVRSRYTGFLRVLNWKTSSSWGDWTDQWTTDPQAFTEAWALAKEAGEEVEGTQMLGFAKGGLRQTGGQAHFGSNLIWGYKRVVDGVTIYHADTKAPAKATPPWVKFPVWEEEFNFYDSFGQAQVARGVEAWVAWLPLHVLAASFMTSEVLVGHPKVVADYLDSSAQQATNDHHILQDGSERDKLLHFTPKFGKWTCGTAAKPNCAFYRVCHTDTTIEELVEAGVLVPRKDHHAVEAGSA